MSALTLYLHEPYTELELSLLDEARSYGFTITNNNRAINIEITYPNFYSHNVKKEHYDIIIKIIQSCNREINFQITTDIDNKCLNIMDSMNYLTHFGYLKAWQESKCTSLTVWIKYNNIINKVWVVDDGTKIDKNTGKTLKCSRHNVYLLNKDYTVIKYKNLEE